MESTNTLVGNNYVWQHIIDYLNLNEIEKFELANRTTQKFVKFYYETLSGKAAKNKSSKVKFYEKYMNGIVTHNYRKNEYFDESQTNEQNLILSQSFFSEIQLNELFGNKKLISD